MKKKYVVIILIVLMSLGIGGFFMLLQSTPNEEKFKEPINTKIKLPEPKYDSNTSVEEALLKRRSIRNYKYEPLMLSEVSQLLWATQGITEPKRGFRTAPSAGALYPLEVYVVIGNVKGVSKGVYKYRPHEHELVKVKDGDVRENLSIAALRQTCVREGAIVILLAAVYGRTTQKYGERGIKYVHMEVGHAGQNVYLQAVSLNLGTVSIGAFKDEEVKKILNMPKEEQPLYILPIGRI